ncbi:MAG: LysM peptidoglycan-binding domain-containing protein, partial [Thermodesulfobacteriota bacterium]|nr:LysM peptidoglycan-binding domain-containing protein [Thermodesulfobacteriota bacterium]
MKTPMLQPKKISLFIILLLPLALTSGLSFAQEEGEETYSISLTKTAEVEKAEVKKEGDIFTVDEHKVLAETYTIKEGEWIWKLFRERGLLKKNNLPAILTMLKRLNSSLSNIDKIHPGQKIIIPLTITPSKGLPIASRMLPQENVDISSINDLELENY